MVAFAGQGVVLVFFVAIYIAYLSLLAFALSAVIVSVAGAIFHFKSRAGRRADARGDRMGQSAVRSSDGPPRRIQGGEAQPLAQRRPVRRRRRGVENGRQHQDTHARANPTNSWSSRRVRCTCCSPPIVFVVPTFSDTKGGLDPQVTTALMFIVGVCMGIVQTIPILHGRECRGGQHRATGGEAAGDCRCDRAR